MGKAKTLKKPKKSSKKSEPVVLHKYVANKPQDPGILREFLIEAIFEDDVEQLADAIIAMLRQANKAEVIRKSGLGRRTIYDIIEGKREFNPSIRTLSSLLKAFAA